MSRAKEHMFGHNYDSRYQSPLDYYGTIPKSMLYGIFGVSLLIEIAIFGFSGYLTSGLQPGMWALLCLIPAFGGVFLTKTDSPVVSLIGGCLCAAGLGAISGPTLAHYKLASIVNVSIYTAFIVVGMTAASVIFRNVFAGLGGMLFTGLMFLIFGDLVRIILSAFGFHSPIVMSFRDCFAVVLFSIYIGYDMAMLENGPQTSDAAVDRSVEVFVDIINIVMSLLRLLGDSDD